MKKLQIMLVLFVLVAMLVGCSNAVSQKQVDEGDKTVSFSANNLTTESNSEIVTQSSTSTTKNTTMELKELSTTVATTHESTTKAETTTKKPTTTKATTQSTTHKQTTTTTKQSTTKPKETTTKKPTTTKQTTTNANKPYFCDEGGTHHSCDVGQIGWVNSYEAAQDKALEYIADHNTSGNFRVNECFYCGKFTASVTLR